jgi:AcrR family transcriptional regulator
LLEFAAVAHGGVPPEKYLLTVTIVTCNTRYIMKTDSSRRAELLDAAIEYLLERGVADLSLRPLAAAVHSKARLLVYHFGSRDSLVTEAMIVVRERVQEAFRSLMKDSEEKTPTEVIRAFWRWATSAEYERYLRLFFEVQGLALQKPAEYGRYLEGAVSTWVEMMSAVLPASLSVQKRKALATLAVGTTFGLLLDYLSSGHKKRSSDAIECFAEDFALLVEREKKQAKRRVKEAGN